MLCNRAPVYSRSPPSNDRNRNTRVTHFNETNRVSHFNETTRTKDEYTSVNKTRRNEPSIELMERLGRGIKPEVTKKEMYEITRMICRNIIHVLDCDIELLDAGLCYLC